MKTQQLDTVLQEDRKFPPAESFSKSAHIGSMEEYQALYRQSLDDPEAYWSEVAGELQWFKKWENVLDSSDKPFFKWFTGGRTNICYNCVDSHLKSATRNKAAIIWEGEPPNDTYKLGRCLFCHGQNK